VDHVKRRGAFVQLGFQRRFDPGYGAARKAVRSEQLGTVHLVRLAGHDPAPPPEQYIADSGGIFRDLCIHDFDVAPWVLGIFRIIQTRRGLGDYGLSRSGGTGDQDATVCNVGADTIK